MRWFLGGVLPWLAVGPGGRGGVWRPSGRQTGPGARRPAGWAAPTRRRAPPGLRPAIVFSTIAAYNSQGPGRRLYQSKSHGRLERSLMETIPLSPMKSPTVLECEKPWIYAVLMGVAGFYGAFTYSIRGGVFCNAQTANFVLFAMALGNGQWSHALYYLIPMSAYFLGAFLSESLAYHIKRLRLIRWDTLLIFLEMLAVVFLGLLPESAPFQISQITINFICSMQYNTFRQTQSIPMATTFCTNHLRQTGVAFCKALRHRDRAHLTRMGAHLGMLLVFVAGGVAATILCRLMQGQAIFVLLLPLSILLAVLLHADLTTEKDALAQIPAGH